MPQSSRDLQEEHREIFTFALERQGFFFLGANSIFSSVATAVQILSPSKPSAGIAIQSTARGSWLNNLPTGWHAWGNICLLGFQKRNYLSCGY